jgi:hypothetical protein
LLTIWQSDYPDDIASCRDLLERTVLDQAGTWQPDADNYAHVAAAKVGLVDIDPNHIRGCRT